MTKILRIDSSIKGPASITRKLTDEIVARLGGAVTERNANGIPLIDGAWIGAAYTPAESRTAEQNAALALSDELIGELEAADVLVIGAPIYNFGVTGPLKAWIDQICRAGVTFKYTETGPVGLMRNKRVIVAYASGGVPMGSAYDLSSSYIKQVLGFIGLTDVTFVAAEGVAADEAGAVARGLAQVAELAA